MRHTFAKGSQGSSGDPDAQCQGCGHLRRSASRDCQPILWGVRECIGVARLLGVDDLWLGSMKAKASPKRVGIKLSTIGVVFVKTDASRAWRTESLGEAQAIAKLLDATVGLHSAINYEAQPFPLWPTA